MATAISNPQIIQERYADAYYGLDTDVTPEIPMRGMLTWNGTAWVKFAGALIPTAYDEVVLSYTGSNLTGVVYKLAGATITTLTLTYDGSDNLIHVVKT